MKFREYLSELEVLKQPSIKFQQFILEIAEMINKEVAKQVSEIVEKNPRSETTEEIVRSMTYLMYEALTKDQIEKYPKTEFSVDDDKYSKAIKKFREKNPKFNSLCIRLKDFVDQYEDARKK